MKYRPSNDQQGKASENSERAMDGYVFDKTSGIYKPQSCEPENPEKQSPQNKQKIDLLEVKVRRDWLALIISIITLIVLFGYTLVTYNLWQEAQVSGNHIQQQLAIAQLQAITAAKELPQIEKQTITGQQQAGIMQRQFEVAQAEQRPWLGHGPISIKKEPVFQLMPIQPPIAADVGLSIDFILEIHNFGTAPALDTKIWTDIELAISDHAAVTKPIMEPSCGTTNAKDFPRGEVIFPNSGINSEFETQMSHGYFEPALRNIVEVRRIWLTGCISYHDGRLKLHHTKFWLRSTFPDYTQWIEFTAAQRQAEASRFHLPPEIIPFTGRFRYMPILGFESWGEEAD
jgi:hypothetical protein